MRHELSDGPVDLPLEVYGNLCKCECGGFRIYYVPELTPEHAKNLWPHYPAIEAMGERYEQMDKWIIYCHKCGIYVGPLEEVEEEWNSVIIAMKVVDNL